MENLFFDAAEDAIIKHTRIIEELENLIAIKREDFRIVDNQTEKEVTGLDFKSFIESNLIKKARIIKANMRDIETCYEQMRLFDKID